MFGQARPHRSCCPQSGYEQLSVQMQFPVEGSQTNGAWHLPPQGGQSPHALQPKQRSQVHPLVNSGQSPPHPSGCPQADGQLGVQIGGGPTIPDQQYQPQLYAGSWQRVPFTPWPGINVQIDRPGVWSRKHPTTSTLHWLQTGPSLPFQDASVQPLSA